MRYVELNNEVLIKKNGFFQLDKDKEAIKEFDKEIKEKFFKFSNEKERLLYLIENKYYINFLENYSIGDIIKLTDFVFSYNFEFKSFMAISKFYKDYALKTNDKKYYLEKYEHRIIATALYLANGDINLAYKFSKAMIEQRYQPATPTFLNSGRVRRGELVSCFLLELDDTLNSITMNISTAMQLSKIGGGVALNLSKLRACGESIKGIKYASKGIIPVMKILEDSFNYADQMGQRKGAGAVYLNIFHSDVMEFLDTKKINSDEKSRIQTLSLGLIVPNKFFELAKNDEPFYVFYPLSVYKKYGKHLDDMNIDEMYDILVKDKEIEKKLLNARELLKIIATTQFESGYPYIIYKSNANEFNPLKDIGDIKMSNLCTEIFQIQTTTKYNDYGEKDDIGYDICCNLGSLNIVNVMESNNIEESVYTAMDALTAVSELSNIKNAPSVSKANKDFHSVGLGVMNLHGYFAKNNIPYESQDAKYFVRTFFYIVNFYSIKRSMQIALEKNKKFKYFEKSDYANGKYFQQYLENDYLPGNEYIKNLFKNIYIPTKEDWKKLKEDVKKNGMYHSYRMAIAPTQNISYIQNSTPSILPIVDNVEVRTYGNSITYYPMPYLSEDNFFYYKSAYNMDMMNIIDLVSEIQPHIDQGISTILYVTNKITTRELSRLYIYAYKKGLKSLYYTRSKNLTIEECKSCSI